MRQAIALSLALWVLIATVAVTLWNGRGGAPVTVAAASSSRDPDLAGCRGGGDGADEAAACRAAWRKARAHFFGRPAS
jgi:conjugative transfer region protein TrbK